MKTKIAVSLDAKLVKQVDALVKRKAYGSRSAAIEAALRSQLKAKRDAEYDALLAQLDPAEEQAMAEERYKGEVFG
jgi:metal-responsive CopG/Arc/MetJ family transcriptional regulator